MQEISNSYGAFSEPFDTEEGSGLVTIHPELSPGNAGIAPTGRYLIYGVHPGHGSCNFFVEQDENGIWFSENIPPFLDKDFILWLGERIDIYYK